MRDGGVRTRGGGVWTRGGGVWTRGGGVWTRGLEAIHEADRLLIPPNVIDTKRGDGIQTKGGGVRTKGGGERTSGFDIYDDPHFLIDDASLDFPSSSPLQHTAFTFSTLLD
ncbi:hypothetical protein CK203_004678 [Vitis vinifera]|uniref:Uncharacterized protein n=1 Tax=Vitis vinifera TaxID=29760 RepID=A0A438KFV3_VITVI|nr:hypothetical protein CK203_004678 [Vitis vinifera]